MRGVAGFSKKREWLKYGLRRVRVATGELAFCVAVCVQWHESQGRCPKVQKNTHICKFFHYFSPPPPLPSPLPIRYHSDVSLQDIANFLAPSQRATKKRTLSRVSSFISYLSFTLLFHHLSISVVFYTVEENLEITVFDKLTIFLALHSYLLYGSTCGWFELHTNCIHTDIT